MLKSLLRFFKKNFRLKREKKRRRFVPSRRRRAVKPQRKIRAHRKTHRKTTKRPPARRAQRRPVGQKAAVKGRVKARLAGEVTHYFPKVRAAVVKCRGSICIGDPIWLKGSVTDFRQTVGSLQIDRAPIAKARPGQEVGLEVGREARPGDKVFILAG